jgi:acyl carrier protein
MERVQDPHADLVSDLIEMLTDLTSDWDTEYSGRISAETRLIADLAFESVDVVHLMVAIQERYGRYDIPFEDLLMVDGRYVTDLRVEQIAVFLARQLHAAGRTS